MRVPRVRGEVKEAPVRAKILVYAHHLDGQAFWILTQSPQQRLQ
jgi:hypothetical protein